MAEQEVVKEKKSGNPMMIILIVLIVVLLGAVGGIGYVLYSKGVLDEPKTEGTAAKGEHGEKEGPAATEEAAHDEHTVFVESEIKELVLNVTNSKGKAQLLKLSFSMKSAEPTLEALVTASKSEIIDVVINHISAVGTEELMTSQGKELLKEELLQEINTIINEAIASNPEIHKNPIKELFFTTFVIK
jgi:flagellar protein FliL